MADLERGASIFPPNLPFYNLKLKAKSFNLKILHKCAPSFFKTCIHHCLEITNVRLVNLDHISPIVFQLHDYLISVPPVSMLYNIHYSTKVGEWEYWLQNVPGCTKGSVPQADKRQTRKKSMDELICQPISFSLH